MSDPSSLWAYLLIGIAGDHHHSISVGQPHVAQVAVALQQLLVLLVHLLPGHDLGVLQQLVGGHTLQGQLSHHPQAPQADPGHVEQLWVLLLQGGGE